jgi:hypothetical protein
MYKITTAYLKANRKFKGEEVPKKDKNHRKVVAIHSTKG